MAPPIARTFSGTDTQITEAAFETLAASLGGRLVLPGADEYHEARRVWNGMIDKRPAAIAGCRGVADVMRCIHFARAHELVVAVRGGAHNVAGFATCDGGLVIERFRGVGSGERGTAQGEGSLARAGAIGDAVADGGGAELVEGIPGLEVEVRLLGVFDEPAATT
jgi:hypothetical protein